MIVLPEGGTSEENMVTHFWNSEDRYQVVTDGPDATCPDCGYPERHRVYEDVSETLTLIADGCPSCETSRMPRWKWTCQECAATGPMPADLLETSHDCKSRGPFDTVARLLVEPIHTNGSQHA